MTARHAPGALAHLLQPDGSVNIPGDVAGELVAAAVRDLTARARRDGLAVSTRALAALEALHRAAVHHDEHQPSSVNGTTPGPSATVSEISAADAAAQLGCSVEYVRRLCRSGLLRGRRIGRAWLVDTASLHHRYGGPA